uniref:Succinate dehydrogenase assembly factor 4, mitochondrial n=1 Tax=Heligmosomoides polygyrus TaxID=6339 RepID=A0A183F4I5_HELPZ
LSPDVQPTVPGQVLRNHKVVKTTHDPKRGRSSEPRLGTATSQHTFVIETERRRPLLLPVGLTEGKNEPARVRVYPVETPDQSDHRFGKIPSNEAISNVAPTVTATDKEIEARLGELGDESQLDYKTVFGARPKVARTPEGPTNRGGFQHNDGF